MKTIAVEGTTSADDFGLQNVSLGQGEKSSLGSSNHEGDSKLATSAKTGETDFRSEETSKHDNNTILIVNSSSIIEDSFES